MKQFSFLSMAVIGLLMVGAVSCTTMQPSSRDYERPVTSTRRYVAVDPNYGYETVLVRDAYTGRYYRVQASPYGHYSDPFYDNRYYNNRYYSQPRHNGNNQQTAEQRAENGRKIQEAKRKILGNEN